MNKYELTVVLAPKTTAAKKKSVVESVEKIVKILKGKLGKTEDWGIKALAYKVGKNDEALFLHMPFELETASVKQLDTKLKMDENILRYLIVKE